MNINWSIIKGKIKSNVLDVFAHGAPPYNEKEITNGIELVIKLALHNSANNTLNGLSRQLIPALQDAYIDKKGELSALRVIADSLEPYLKKLAILVTTVSHTSINEMGLIGLLKLLNLNQALSAQTGHGYPNFIQSNITSFKGKDEYLEYLCSGYLTRNEVHVSQPWNEIEVFVKLRDLLIIYIYATLKYAQVIEDLPKPDTKTHFSEEVLGGNENKLLYDFISFGNTTTEIKTQIINAYILHYLMGKETVSIEKIKVSCDEYFDNVLNIKYYQRKVERLYQDGKIKYSDFNRTTIELSESERLRLKKVQDDFNENKDLFLLYFEELLSKYGIIHHYDSILEKLTEFFVANFNIDVSEAYNKGFDSESNENDIFREYIDYIKKIISDDEIAKSFFKEMLELCEQSDFIVRVSASKVLGKLTNPDYFHNYIRQQKRVVYIDTQLVLHMLCVGYKNKLDYNNIYFKIVDELVTFANDNPNIGLKLSKLYLSEVAYQLKLALLLIPYEDFASSKFSNNVFYQFYSYLKETNSLDNRDETFADFLEGWFNIYEDDAYDTQVDKIIISNISDILTNEYGIEIVHLPYYENREQAVAILEQVIKDNHAIKPHHVLNNDACMLIHLSNMSEHLTEPFFLTWDKAFSDFRKTYKEKFHRSELISWHLFNPSKFLNHMSLLEFKIDPKSITNEYISIIDSFGLQDKTKTLFDNMNRFTDIKNISKIQRRKYVQITKELFNVDEFSYEINLPDEEIKQSISRPFESVIDEINKYYHDTNSKFNIDQYRKMLLTESYFVNVAEIVKYEIKKSISNSSPVSTDPQRYINEINNLLERYYAPNQTP